MGSWTGIGLAGAALLVLAGAPKVLRPDTTRRALRSVGWPVPGWTVRVGGAAEVVIGLVAVAYGGRVAAALVAASYLGFSGFVVLALRRGGTLASCGCIGRPDTPPTGSHVAATLLLAGGALGAAVSGRSGLRGMAHGSVGEQAALAAFTALVLWLAWLVLAELPRLRTSRLRTSRPAHD